MAEVTVDRLVVLIEAQTRSFEAQLKKIEGQTVASSRRMSAGFAAFNTQLRQTGSAFGRAFGFGGVGRGPLALLVALGYAVNKTANSFGDLRKEAMEAGVAIDENILGRGEKFNNEWDRALTSIKIKILGAFGSSSFKDAMRIIDSMFNKSGQKPLVSEATQVVQRGAKGDMLAPSAEGLQKFNDLLAMSNRLLTEYEQKQSNIKEAATGLTDSFRDFTFSTIDDFNSIGDAAINLGKTIEKNLIDALLFGGGPFAGLMGTGPNPNAVTPGGPSGLIGGAIGGLFGRTFGNTTGGLTGQSGYNYNEGVSGSGAITPIGSITSKIADQIFGSTSQLPGGVTSRGAATPYNDLINEAAGKYSLDPNLLSAMIRQESGFNPSATSTSGAMGLTQLMPGTAHDLGVTNAYDPRQSIFGGAQYLSQQVSQFGTQGGIAAYNMGPKAYSDYLAGQRTMPAETQAYLASILGFLKIPMMAGGGSLGGGQPAIVGERGPELFVPRAPGNVMPMNGGSGSRVTVYSYGAQTEARTNSNGDVEVLVNKHLKRTLRDSYGIGPRRTGRN
jgi:hypothetical protein